MPSDAADPDLPLEVALREPADVDAVLDALAGLWRRHPDVPDVDRFCFETAVAEVAGNAVAHAGGGPAGTTATVRAGIRHAVGVRSAAAQAVGSPAGGSTGTAGGSRRELWAEVVDHGSAVDLAEHRELPADDAVSGRGLALARRSLTHLGVERVGDANHWLLVRLVD